MSSDSSQDAIRDLAYQKWEQAGCPDGDGVNFWLDAEHDLQSAPSIPTNTDLDATIDELEVSFPENDAPPIKMAKAGGSSRKRAG